MGFTTFPGNEHKWKRTDWSRPTFTVVKQEPIEEKESKPNAIQPRFSVFGKSQQDTKQPKLKEKPATCNFKRSTFQLHLSTKSSANYKFDQSTPQSPTTSPEPEEEQHQEQPNRTKVQFDPVCLERVCLFLESQCPIELKEAHDRQLTQPSFRILCPHWPRQESHHANDQQVVILNRKHFSMIDNKYIRGKVMVRNLALDKAVLIRYTLDHWATVSDVDGVFFGPNPKNTAFDIYEFTLELNTLSDRGEVRGKVEFSIRYTAGHMDYYDDNNGQHYQIRVICDPLYDPWVEKEAVQNDSNHYDDNTTSEDEEEEIEEEEEKHSQFANALKDYKPATPFHLKRRQPWFSARYDFSQSLFLAKQSPHHDTSASFVGAKDYFLPITSSEYIHPPPSSTTTSPTLSHTSSLLEEEEVPLDINSSHYLEMLDKYCFYHSNENDTTLKQFDQLSIDSV
ncbi:putative phosphatase regulatory subunit-domain-containing protein [Blakeslea trispora]|nr:putative phosphatase regulatory subunit-domain-containing protein [Blakeslea trispora]